MYSFARGWKELGLSSRVPEREGSLKGPAAAERSWRYREFIAVFFGLLSSAGANTSLKVC